MNTCVKKISKSCSSLQLTPEQIYEISSEKGKGGIEGYNIQRKYFDYRASIQLKKRETILKQNRAPWPPGNWIENNHLFRLKNGLILFFIKNNIN